MIGPDMCSARDGHGSHEAWCVPAALCCVVVAVVMATAMTTEVVASKRGSGDKGQHVQTSGDLGGREIR